MSLTMDLLGPRSKDHICFYTNRASGECGWLTSDQVMQVMSDALEYETVQVTDQSNMDKFGERWYGVRVCATNEEAPEEEILYNGQKRILAKRWFDQLDRAYYFRCIHTRDTVVDYLTHSKPE